MDKTRHNMTDIGWLGQGLSGSVTHFRAQKEGLSLKIVSVRPKKIKSVFRKLFGSKQAKLAKKRARFVAGQRDMEARKQRNFCGRQEKLLVRIGKLREALDSKTSGFSLGVLQRELINVGNALDTLKGKLGGFRSVEFKAFLRDRVETNRKIELAITACNVSMHTKEILKPYGEIFVAWVEGFLNPKMYLMRRLRDQMSLHREKRFDNELNLGWLEIFDKMDFNPGDVSMLKGSFQRELKKIIHDLNGDPIALCRRDYLRDSITIMSNPLPFVSNDLALIYDALENYDPLKNGDLNYTSTLDAITSTLKKEGNPELAGIASGLRENVFDSDSINVAKFWCFDVMSKLLSISRAMQLGEDILNEKKSFMANHDDDRVGLDWVEDNLSEKTLLLHLKKDTLRGYLQTQEIYEDIPEWVGGLVEELISLVNNQYLKLAPVSHATVRTKKIIQDLIIELLWQDLLKEDEEFKAENNIEKLLLTFLIGLKKGLQVEMAKVKKAYDGHGTVPRAVKDYFKTPLEHLSGSSADHRAQLLEVLIAWKTGLGRKPIMDILELLIDRAKHIVQKDLLKNEKSFFAEMEKIAPESKESQFDNILRLLGKFIQDIDALGLDSHVEALNSVVDPMSIIKREWLKLSFREEDLNDLVAKNMKIARAQFQLAKWYRDVFCKKGKEIGGKESETRMVIALFIRELHMAIKFTEDANFSEDPDTIFDDHWAAMKKKVVALKRLVGKERKWLAADQNLNAILAAKAPKQEKLDTKCQIWLKSLGPLLEQLAEGDLLKTHYYLLDRIRVTYIAMAAKKSIALPSSVEKCLGIVNAWYETIFLEDGDLCRIRAPWAPKALLSIHNLNEAMSYKPKTVIRECKKFKKYYPADVHPVDDIIHTDKEILKLEKYISRADKVSPSPPK